MSKIIIPRNELPNLSQEGVNRFRFRVINKNRNLSSQWSVIGNIKRPEEQVDYELPDTFTVSPGDNHLLAIWERNINTFQEYEVYFKQYYRTFDMFLGSFRYSADPINLSEVTDKTTSFVYGSFSSRVGINPPTPMGAQVMIRNYRYPRVEKNKWQVLYAEVVSNVLSVYIQAGVTDFDNINNSIGKVFADTVISDSLNPFLTFEEMEIFNSIRSFTTVDKSNPSYTILRTTATSAKDIIISKPGGSFIQRIDHDPLFVSEYVDWT